MAQKNTCEFEVLMSVMNQKDFSIAYKTKVNSDLLIINQCNEDSYTEERVNGFTWRMISTTDRGLSRSRNLAIKNARGEICLFCDDDEIFEEGYEKKILSAYREISDATCIVFNLNRINYKMKKSYYTISEVRKAPFYRGYSSQMVTFKRKTIVDNGIILNERLGSGTAWGGGEEILFQRDIKKAGYWIYEHPATIATIDYSEGSQWFTGYDYKYFYNLGAFSGFAKTNPIYRELRFLYVSFYKLRREKKLSPFEKYRWMHLGLKGMRKNVTYNEFLENGNRFTGK